jgi:hypothetical protein
VSAASTRCAHGGVDVDAYERAVAAQAAKNKRARDRGHALWVGKRAMSSARRPREITCLATGTTSGPWRIDDHVHLWVRVRLEVDELRRCLKRRGLRLGRQIGRFPCINGNGDRIHGLEFTVRGNLKEIV